MERSQWIKERRHLNEERMDTLFAPDYDEHWGRINPTHRAMLESFLDLCPPGCLAPVSASSYPEIEITRKPGDGYLEP